MSSAAHISDVSEAGVRARLAKLAGMLGSEHDGERSSAVAMLDRALRGAGLTWAWIGELVERGELAGGERERLLSRLAGDRLQPCDQLAWCMDADNIRLVRGMQARLASGHLIEIAELERAIAAVDEARRRAGRR